MEHVAEHIESAAQFANTPSGKAQRWTIEIQAARENLRTFWKDGDRAVRAFLNETPREDYQKKTLPLFFADFQSKAATLSGTPKVRAKRRYADPADDVARVSADILERHLNADIQREDDGYREALALARDDYLRPGLGVNRYRYVVETEKVPAQKAMTKRGPCECTAGGASMTDCEACEGTGEVEHEIAPAVPASEQKSFEDVETDYVYWRDFLWSPARTWSEVRWVAFRLEMTRDAAVERWPKFGKELPLKQKRLTEDEAEKDLEQVWSRIEVWEVWDKETKTRLFHVEGFREVLEEEEDPHGLPNFFPCQKPLIANAVTGKLIPKATYTIAEGLYQEAHELTNRIRWLVKSIKAVGACDKDNEPLTRVLDEAVENQIIPVENFSKLWSDGNMEKAVWFLPIEPQVNAVMQLVQQRNLVRQELYEITGQSDITRGQAAQKATATEQRIKARMFSGRQQSEQDELARFASEGQRIRAFLICKHFDPETIIQRSNIESAEMMDAPQPPPAPAPQPMQGAPGMPPGMPPPAPAAPPPPPKRVPNAPLIQQAVELLKSDLSAYRIDVDAESLAMTDYDAIQQEGIAIMDATAAFFQRFGPFLGNPEIVGFVLELYQAMISRFRGAERYEGIIDRAVQQFKQMATAPKPPPPPDPKLEAEKVKAQAEIMKAKTGLQQTQMDAQAHAQTVQMDMAAKQQDFGMRMAEIRAKREAALDFQPITQGEIQ